MGMQRFPILETRNEKGSRDSRHIVDGFHLKSAGPAVTTVAHDAHVRASGTGRDHPLARGWLHGPSNGRREWPAPIYFRGGRKIPDRGGPSRRQGDPRDKRAPGDAQKTIL